MKPILLFTALLCGILAARGAVSDLDKKYNVKPGGGEAKPQAKTRSTNKKSANVAKRDAKKQTTPPAKQVQPADEGTTLFSGLYNGEEINMPNALLLGVEDLNAQLKAVLSESDYLAILKGELAWYLSKTKGNTPKGDFSGLRLLLGKILEDPGNKEVFRWPRIIDTQRAGTIMAESFSDDDVVYFWTDSKYIFSLDGKVWNTRTGKVEMKLGYAGPYLAVTRIPGSSMYFVSSLERRVNSYYENQSSVVPGTWQEKGTGYGAVLDAEKQRLQTFVFGTSPDLWKYYNPERTELFQQSRFPLARYMKIPHFEETGSTDCFFSPSGKQFAFLRVARAYEEVTDEMEPCLIDRNAGEPHIPELTGKPKIPADVVREAFDWEELSPIEERTLEPSDMSLEYGGYVLSLKTLRRSVTRNLNDKAQTLYSVFGGVPRCFVYEEPMDFKFSRQVGEVRGYVFFTMSTTCYDNPRNYSTYNQLVGVVTPGKKVYVFKGWKNKVLVPYSEYAASSRSDDWEKVNPCHQVGMSPLSIWSQEDGKVTLVWNESRGVGRSMNFWKGPWGDDWATNPEMSLKETTHVLTFNVANGKIESEKVLPGYTSACLEKGTLWVRRDWGNHYVVERGSVDERKKIMDFYTNPGAGHALVLPNGHYSATPGSEALLEYCDGRRTMGVEPFAPWRNRPAEVLEVLGGDSDDIAALNETTRRWLAKKGYDMGNMPPEPSMDDFPEAYVQLPELEQTADVLALDVRLTAKAAAIRNLEVRAEGQLIPQPGAGDLTVPPHENKTVPVKIPLADGQNWIELTPMDANGLSGATQRFRVVKMGAARASALYVVSIGVSEYEDESLRLQYAAKDAQDIAKVFSELPGTVHTLTLTDAEFRDSSALQKITAFLASATVNDRIVMYCAGHGVLDGNLDYYYAPAAFNPEDISGSGISMKELVAGLTQAVARRKLLLLDTCHAGTVGEEDEQKLAMAGVALPPGVRAISQRGMKVTKAKGVSNANQRKRFIEEMFALDSDMRGLNIISASAGAEYALESDQWKNGVFALAVIQAMEDQSSDSDKDGTISVPELYASVDRKVKELTNGAQSPNLNCQEYAGYYKIGGLRGGAAQYTDQEVEALLHMYLNPENPESFRECLHFPVSSSGKMTDCNQYADDSAAYRARWKKMDYRWEDCRITKLPGGEYAAQLQYFCELVSLKGKTIRLRCRNDFKLKAFPGEGLRIYEIQETILERNAKPRI